mmetsp:Transcript_28684/g.80756  ORF Transcript_28684/g.80756 Transcript_28684/m.80756 type:complete len:175 (+) Transcript_28684:232-756(+)
MERLSEMKATTALPADGAQLANTSAPPSGVPHLEDAKAPSGAAPSAPSDSSHHSEVRPMYQWIAAEIFKPIQRWTAGTARVDLRRPCLPLDHQPGDNLWRVASPTTYTGARMKLMRDLQLFHREGYAPWVSLGLGCNYEMDSNSLGLQVASLITWPETGLLPLSPLGFSFWCRS